MKSTLIGFVSLCFIAAYAQPVPQRTVVPVDIEKIDYPNLAGKTTSSQPHPGTVLLTDGTSVKGKITFFKKSDVFERIKVKTETDKVEIMAAQIKSISLDPKVYEGKYPNNFKKPEKNFQPGYIVLPTGEKLNGKVAQLRDFSDYDFFTYTILFLPEGSSVASGIQGGKADEFGQMIDGTMRVWDGYADGYLLRMVDGRYRLSRNPYSKTKNEFFTSLKNHLSDSLAKQAAGATLVENLKAGTNLNESIENATNAGSAVSEVMGAIEINRKEYLIFDTKNNSVIAVNSDSFKPWAESIGRECGVSAPQNWDKIEDFIRSLNEKCK